MVKATRLDIQLFFKDTENYTPDPVPPWRVISPRSISAVDREEVEKCLLACWDRIAELESQISDKAKTLADFTLENELLESMLLHFGRKKAILALSELFKKEST
jgi:hypothetical protein